MQEILLNKNALKINQDPMGIQGRRVFQDKVSVSLKIKFLKVQQIQILKPQILEIQS